jgi:hypothetical protein
LPEEWEPPLGLRLASLFFFALDSDLEVPRITFVIFWTVLSVIDSVLESFGDLARDVDLKEDQKAAKKLEKSETGEKSKKGAAKETGGGEKKDLDKKSAVEKRKEFQSHKNSS